MNEPTSSDGDAARLPRKGLYVLPNAISLAALFAAALSGMEVVLFVIADRQHLFRTDITPSFRRQAIAGSLAAKKRLAQGPGTLPTHGPLFVGLLVGTVLLLGALTYVPALALGPAVEHLILWAGN